MQVTPGLTPRIKSASSSNLAEVGLYDVFPPNFGTFSGRFFKNPEKREISRFSGTNTGLDWTGTGTGTVTGTELSTTEFQLVCSRKSGNFPFFGI